MGFPGDLVVRFNPWVGKTLWRRKWQPTPVLFPGKSHGRRSPVGCTVHGVAKSRTRLSDLSSLRYSWFTMSWQFRLCSKVYNFSKVIQQQAWRPCGHKESDRAEQLNWYIHTCIYIYMYIHTYVYIHTDIYRGASLVAQLVKNLPAVQETWVWSLGREDPLKEGMATHSSILAWRLPGTEEYSPWRATVHGGARSWTRLNN